MVGATTHSGDSHPKAAVVGGPLWLPLRIEKSETLPVVKIEAREVEGTTKGCHDGGGLCGGTDDG